MIEVRRLSKHFGKLFAVDQLSFTVERGDAVGFIGPNGAGKTTTIRMLATLLPPDSGTAIINGHDIIEEPEAVRTSVGYMPDFFGVYDDMKAWEYLDFFAAAYRVPYQDRPGLIDDVLELTDLKHKRDAYVDSLSRGMKQRLCLAKTLVHDPEVLLLDEPASGLDPRARIEIRDLLKELCQMDKTVLISSHILTELADLCSKVIIIEQGRLVTAGSVDEIASRIQGGVQLRVELREHCDEACAFLCTQPGILRAEVKEGTVIAVYCGTEGCEDEVLTALVAQGFKVRAFAQDAVNLEDVYMRVTQGVGS
jgi:ABC-2 type transport system ATP-binding protein